MPELPRILALASALSGGLALITPVLAAGQALDVGGIEIRLGQDVSDVLRRLSAYKVTYNDQIGAWFITQKPGDRYELLGSIGATAGRVSSISKSYDLASVGATSRVYTLARNDLRRRGGEMCTTDDAVYTDDIVHSINTRCGPYTLSFFLPTTYENAPTDPSISIAVGKQ